MAKLNKMSDTFGPGVDTPCCALQTTDSHTSSSPVTQKICQREVKIEEKVGWSTV